MALGSDRVALYGLTPDGARLGRQLAKDLDGAVLFLSSRLEPEFAQAQYFDRLARALADNFNRFSGHVLFCAAGIAVRALAPLLRHKTEDPAVVVVDQEGKFAVSLLSGHLGGANELARKVALVLGGQAVITTATDLKGLPSLEMEAARLGCHVENIQALARISSDLLAGKQVPVFDPGGWLSPVTDKWPGLFSRVEEAGVDLDELVCVGRQEVEHPPGWLMIRPPCLGVGLGCNRGTPKAEIRELIQEVFELEGLSQACIRVLASAGAKRDEPGLLELGRDMGLPLVFYEPRELKQIKVPNPSEMVERHMGVSSVCEAAAILATNKGDLLVQKRKTKNVTLAVALASFTSSA